MLRSLLTNILSLKNEIRGGVMTGPLNKCLQVTSCYTSDFRVLCGALLRGELAPLAGESQPIVSILPQL